MRYTMDDHGRTFEFIHTGSAWTLLVYPSTLGKGTLDKLEKAYRKKLSDTYGLYYKKALDSKGEWKSVGANTIVSLQV